MYDNLFVLFYFNLDWFFIHRCPNFPISHESLFVYSSQLLACEWSASIPPFIHLIDAHLHDQVHLASPHVPRLYLPL